MSGAATASEHAGLRDGIILAAEAAAFGEELVLPRLARTGELIRVDRGLYFNARNWSDLTPTQRYEVRVRGASLKRHGAIVLSHHSAAVLWGLPLLGSWPRDVHFLVERASGGRSTPGIRRHALGLDADDVTTIDGMLVTSLARTVIDMAATLDLVSAIVLIDFAIHIDRFGRRPQLVRKHELFEQLERMLPFRGSRRVLRRIQFASEHSDSPAESASRVNIALCGFPQPRLQHRFVIANGHTAEVDFFWEEFHAVGECDGRAKYVDERMLAGRTTADVLYLEKQREDAIREQVRAFARWDAHVAQSQYRLRAKLLRLGLPTGAPTLYQG